MNSEEVIVTKPLDRGAIHLSDGGRYLVVVEHQPVAARWQSGQALYAIPDNSRVGEFYLSARDNPAETVRAILAPGSSTSASATTPQHEGRPAPASGLKAKKTNQIEPARSEPTPASSGCAGLTGSCLLMAIGIGLILFALLLNALFPNLHLLW